MFTLVLPCVWSERPQEDSVSWTGGCRNYRPHFWLVSILLEMSAASKSRRKSCVYELSVLWSEWNKLSVLSEEAKFPELQYSCGYALHNNKQILIVTLQCHHILMQELENGVSHTRWTRSSSFGIDIACHGLVKGCLTFWFC